MKIISILNFKGGIGKTLTAVNIAYTLASEYKKNVLIIDNDERGHTSKMFQSYTEDGPGIGELLTKEAETGEIIKKTPYTGICIMPANMNLLTANLSLIKDTTKDQTSILKSALSEIQDLYDYCIIDNAPDLNISVINALSASDGVISPVRACGFDLDGLEELKNQLEEIRAFNPSICFLGAFMTMYRNDEVNRQSREVYQKRYEMFSSVIRYSKVADKTTFARLPAKKYSSRCNLAYDYMKLTGELIKKCATL